MWAGWALPRLFLYLLFSQLKNLPNVYKIHISRLTPMGNWPEDLIRKVEEGEEEEESIKQYY
jgi:hypothetical protein